jgi:putative zinc finger protein
MHETNEALSAYVDGEVSPAERSRIQGHIASCPDCAARTNLLEGASASLRGLPALTPTADESRRIRQGVLGRTRRRSFAPWLRPQWVGAGVGALALVVAGIYAGTGMLRRGGDDQVTAARDNRSTQQSGAPEAVFNTVEELRSYVSADAAIRDSLKTPPSPPAAKPAPARSLDEDSSGKGDAGTAPSAPAPAPAAAPETAENTAKSFGAAPAAPERPAEDCLTDLLRTQGPEVRPVLTRPATWEGKPAWLLVLARAPSKAGEKESLQVYLVGRADCGLLTYQFTAAP